jgi:hypothetical protein
VPSLFDRATQKDAAAILRPAGTFPHIHAIAEERNVL